eukprot:PhF_6_TR27033/c0_g1_i1/m.39483
MATSPSGKKRPQGIGIEINRDRAISAAKLPSTVTEVIPDFLFLGSVLDALNTETLHDIGATHVMCMAKECDTPTTPALQVKKVCLADTSRETLRANFQECFAFIEAAREVNGRVLVYCRKGASRSASVVIAYCMTYRKMSFQDALKYVQSKRDVVDPNVGFMGELEEYDAMLARARGPADPLASEDCLSPHSPLMSEACLKDILEKTS